MAIKASNQITFTEHKKIIEIKEWYLATPKDSGITTNPEEGWTLEIQTIDDTNKYLWNYEEVVYSIGSSEISNPVIIGFYGKGSDGKGISDIKNYYYITSTPELPDSPDWSPTTLLLTPTNKYLWNYEDFIYTDGTSKSTDPAIIGVYGDSGTSAITFEIYSVHGFMFKENLKSIELKIAAFEGSEPIDNVTYIWSWWDGSLNNGEGGYSIITETAESSFIVDDSDAYAFASLKCTMEYDNKTYEDYVVLTSEAVIYNAAVKFFDGSNIFHSDDLYLVAYIELYQNNSRIETISSKTYCPGISSVSSSGVITTTLNDNFDEGDKVYFICQNDDGSYYAILGEYMSGEWKQIDENISYIYTNSIYSNIQSNVIVISKESVNKSQNIDFTVYKDGAHIADSSVMVIDSNDPIISAIAPENPVNNQLWLDTSSSPHVLKIYSENTWVECSEQIGGAVFTSRPIKYSAGDLWILATGETCKEFRAGSMLKATTTSSTFNESHWVDADAESTKLENNIKQYFAFDANTGLKIGQSDQKFSVNISSTKMGFHEGDVEVVSISNKSAQIDNLTVEGGLTADCRTTLKGDTIMQRTVSNTTHSYVWQVEESNGSLSLAIMI